MPSNITQSAEGDYSAFLARKERRVHRGGITLPADALHPHLFPFQRAIVSWALGLGRAAIFADTGLGKTIMQLEVIRRGVRLWSNPGDVVLSPFMGIGSEGFESLKMCRKFIGVELKRSYFEQAVANLNAAIVERDAPNLFEATV